MCNCKMCSSMVGGPEDEGIFDDLEQIEDIEGVDTFIVMTDEEMERLLEELEGYTFDVHELPQGESKRFNEMAGLVEDAEVEDMIERLVAGETIEDLVMEELDAAELGAETVEELLRREAAEEEAEILEPEPERYSYDADEWRQATHGITELASGIEEAYRARVNNLLDRVLRTGEILDMIEAGDIHIDISIKLGF